MWLKAEGWRAVPTRHANRLDFSGILTRVGVPSDAPPNGSNGKRILLTRTAAEKALPTLRNMGVNVTDTLVGHNAGAKVGVIEHAMLDGDAIRVSGTIWCGDFPNEAAKLALRQADLGLSFEAQRVMVADQNADPLVILACQFTGAAVLLRSEAAYRDTIMSIAASRAKETPSMTKITDKAGDILLPRHLFQLMAAANIKGPADLDRLDQQQLARLLENKTPGQRMEIKTEIMRAGLYPRDAATFSAIPLPR